MGEAMNSLGLTVFILLLLAFVMGLYFGRNA